ncbi:hypothetical protein LUZ60_009848 [Juncus effusus]|nr:hypothetical protein LUZ60_009848 [Juncus effusus]
MDLTSNKNKAMGGQEIKLMRVFQRIEPRNFAVGLLLGCFLVTFAYFSMAKFDSIHFFATLNVNSSVSVENANPPPSSDLVQNIVSSKPVDVDKELKNIKSESEQISSKNSNASVDSKSPSLNEESLQQSTVQELDSDLKVEIHDMAETCEKKPELCKFENVTISDKNLSSISNSGVPIVRKAETQPETTLETKPAEPKFKKQQVPMCDLSQRRIDKCELEGDVRIMGQNATIMWVANSESDSPDYERKEWQIKPYPRKEDPNAMAHVSLVKVKPIDNSDEAPACTDHRDVPAIVFSDRGYTGNYFHDFTDVLVPIFTTARRFKGEVEFLISDFKIFWIVKYLPIFNNLSNYKIINFDTDQHVRCYKQAFIGLTSHDDFGIDPERTAERYTLVDFTRFLRTTYGCKRDTVEIPVGKMLRRKPRLLIIARGRSRRFVNLEEIIRSAEKTGFEVVATEADGDLEVFAPVVNSCDVIMGVHGAGLSNMVFLPINAVFIQILPWGGLEWVAGNYFKRPVEKMELKYLQYDIVPEESTLIDEYPLNHTVFTNPEVIRNQGWKEMAAIFLDKQNVRLNVRRFRPTLKKALKHLNSIDS